jgi:hypothetical protein
MTYSSGSLIQATDYNGFVSTNSGANVNSVWNTLWGQSALSTVSTSGTVTATQWASLVNTLASMGSQTKTALTARTAPTTGQTIGILSALNTDLTNCTTNARNAAAVGAQFTGWTGTNSNTAGASGATWSITFTNTITWASSAAASYFFNAGGLIKLDTSKTATGNTGDPEWNDLANTLCGDIYISGASASKTIAGTAYTGITKIGGTGTPNVLSTATGWDALTAGAAATIVYKQFADTAPYTTNYIQHAIAKNAGSTALTITTTWYNGDSDPISGGTAASGATPGTGACTICTYFPPSTTYLTNSWGSPTVAATTA